MSVWRAAWLVASIGMSLGLNHLTKPAAEYTLSIGERTMSTGKLRLQAGGAPQDIELVTIRVIAQDLPRVLADPLRVRELWVRSPEQDGAPPDLELFVDLEPEPGQPIVKDASELADLRGRELPVRAHAQGSEARSRIRLHGAPAPQYVREGRLLITDATSLGAGTQSVRIRGELDLSLEDGDQSTAVRGELNARLVW